MIRAVQNWKGVKTVERGDFFLEHSFSDLGPLQQAHTIRYACSGKGQSCEITVQDGACTERCSLRLGRKHAEMLVRFLYENAVMLENWRDVVADVTSMLLSAEV